jgi:CRP/FNR family transcriptional regulator
MNELPNTLVKLTQGSRLKHYPKGQIIIYQEDKSHEIVLLAKGYIKIYDIDKQGNEKVLHIVKKGALAPFSFFSGVEQETRWFYAALTDCDVYVFSANNLEEKLQQDNELLLFLTHWFCLEVHEILTRLSSMGKSSAKMKLIAALRFLAKENSKQRPSGWIRVNFPVNHQLLADMTGVTRESAATIMKNLTKREYVRNPRQTILEINSKQIYN